MSNNLVIMKKVLFVIVFMCCMSSSAENTVFPILNTLTDYPEFVSAEVVMSYNGQRNVMVASDLGIWMNGSIFRETMKDTSDKFVSFSYVSRKKSLTDGEWNTGGEAIQFAFHPGGMSGYAYGTNSPTKSPLFAFTCGSEHGLCIVDLNTPGCPIVAKLSDETNAGNLSYLTVFAQSDITMPDIIVVAGKTGFNVFKTIPVENGVRAISYSGSTPSYFGINGQKYDDPQPGLNIVVDGDKSKKIVVK